MYIRIAFFASVFHLLLLPTQVGSNPRAHAAGIFFIYVCQRLDTIFIKILLWGGGVYFGFLQFDLQICAVWLGFRVPWQAGIRTHSLGGGDRVGFGSAQFSRLNPPML